MANKIRWLGHAAFEITTAQGCRILIDPWLTGNPSCPVKAADVAGADLILITHDHHDHYGSDLPELVKANSIVVGQPEVVAQVKQDGIAAENVINSGSGMNIGGTVTVMDVKVTMTQAVHSSAAGTPCGFIVTLEDGTVIYHAGDTGIFASMKLFGELYDLDVALLPIGSAFVMDPLQAAKALQLLQPKIAIPMHYKTFAALEQSPDSFLTFAREKAPQVEIRILQPGETTNIG